MKKILLALCMLPMAFAATSMSPSSGDNYEERCQAVLEKTSQAYAKDRGEKMNKFLGFLNSELSKEVQGVTKLAPACNIAMSGFGLRLSPPNIGQLIENMKSKALEKVNEACESARSKFMGQAQEKLSKLNKNYTFAGQRVGVNTEVHQ